VGNTAADFELRSRPFTCATAGDFTIQAAVELGMNAETTTVGSDGFSETGRTQARAFVILDTMGTCHEARETKVEFAAEQTDLGMDRIESLDVGAMGSVNLDDHGGKYAFYVQLEPGQTIDVSVFGSASINYFPEYSPGYTFVDTAPGSTSITNLDAERPNGVLVVLEGSSTVDVSTIAT